MAPRFSFGNSMLRLALTSNNLNFPRKHSSLDTFPGTPAAITSMLSKLCHKAPPASLRHHPLASSSLSCMLWRRLSSTTDIVLRRKHISHIHTPSITRQQLCTCNIPAASPPDLSRGDSQCLRVRSEFLAAFVADEGHLSFVNDRLRNEVV